jgi:hypothetical protein
MNKCINDLYSFLLGHVGGKAMTSETLNWWFFLCAVSALNILVWTASAAKLRHPASLFRPASWSAIHWQMLLSAGYVLGCAYRSVFPVFDVQRLCMFDSWLSSVIVGRSVATVAELCFAAQWAFLLRSVATSCGSVAAVKVSRMVVPMILVAETCSWYAVLTTSNLGHVLEESLWGLCAAMLVGSFLFLWPHCARAIRPILFVASVIGLGYVYYMFEVDVPMYWARWVLDESHGQQYLSISQGLADVSGRWVVSQRWVDWESEVIWMSLYFSVAVWLSIGLMHVARVLGAENPPAHTGKRTLRPELQPA